MPTEHAARYWHKAGPIEGLALLAVAPLLLFPERFPLLTAVALLVVAALWVMPLLIIRAPLIPPMPFNLILLVLLITILIGVVVTADPALTLPKATGLILGFSVWRLLVLAVRSRKMLTWATLGYIAAGTAFVALGFLSANWLLKGMSQVPLPQILPQPDGPSLLDLGGNGTHPNQIAGTITLLLPLVLALLLDAPFERLARGRLARLMLLVLSLALIYVLLLTQSRSGWLGAAGGIVTLLVLWSLLLPNVAGRRYLRVGLLLFALAAGLLLAVVGPQSLIDVWLDPPQETAVGSLTTINFRRQLWPWALAAIADFPYTGTGLGAFRAVATRLYPAPIPPAFDLGHAHNVFLQVALDIGLPGVIAYLALVLVCFAIGWQIARRDPRLRAVGIGLIASLTAFHLFGLADTVALGAKPALLFWGIVGLLGAMPQLIE